MTCSITPQAVPRHSVQLLTFYLQFSNICHVHLINEKSLSFFFIVTINHWYKPCFIKIQRVKKNYFALNFQMTDLINFLAVPHSVQLLTYYLQFSNVCQLHLINESLRFHCILIHLQVAVLSTCLEYQSYSMSWQSLQTCPKSPAL